MQMSRINTKILAVIAAILVTFPAVAQKNMSFGLRGGYVTRNESGSAGLYFQYRFVDHFRLAPSVDYVFSHKNVSGLLINLDGQVPFDLTGGRVTVYPIAGLNFSSWDYKYHTNDVTTRVNRFGVNIGGGIEYHIKPTLKIGVEAKYVGVKGHSCGDFTASIGYVF